MSSVPVPFTRAEFWLLNAWIRHDQESGDDGPYSSRARYPIVSTELNEEIALALVACEDDDLDEYRLELGYGDLLLIDHHVRADFKNPEGAKGKDILMKTFRARMELALGEFGRQPATEQRDQDYKTAIRERPIMEEGETEDASTGNESNKDADKSTDA